MVGLSQTAVQLVVESLGFPDFGLPRRRFSGLGIRLGIARLASRYAAQASREIQYVFPSFVACRFPRWISLKIVSS